MPGEVSSPLKTSPESLLDPDTEQLCSLCVCRDPDSKPLRLRRGAAWRLEVKPLTFSPCRARRKVGPPSSLFSLLSLFSPPYSPTSPIPQLDTAHVCAEGRLTRIGLVRG